MIDRYCQNLDAYIQKGKVLVIFGPRQVGKTTLITEYLKHTKYSFKLESGDNVSLHEILGSQRFDSIIPFASEAELLVLDEAQRIPNIGMALKIIVDQVPNARVVVTGSASFELAGQVGEPLTGRKNSLILYPVSQLELSQSMSKYELKEKLPLWLIYGGYPVVLSESSKEAKRKTLEEISNSYLLKDILELSDVKGAKVLLDLLRLLALQLGNQVSLSEMAAIVGLDYKTVARYLDLFEKAFIIFQLRGYSRNLRSEINTKSKYYFFDTGIRNAIINNFNALDLRNDTGPLFENFLVMERLKLQSYKQVYANNYFWRTWEQKEVDWVEEREGKLFGFEFTWSNKHKKRADQFLTTYPEAEFKVIDKDYYLQFVIEK